MIIWEQLIFQKINNYEGYTFIDTAATHYKLKPTDECAGTVPKPHNEFIAIVSLGGEEIDMYHPVPSQSMYSKIDYKTIFNEERVTPIRTTYTYYAPLPNPLQFEFLSNNFIIHDTLGKRIDYLPAKGKASLTFDIDATTEYTYYWIRNVGYDVHFNDPSAEIDGVDGYGDGVFGYFIYDIPKGMGGYSITLPRNEDGSYNLDSIVSIDGKPFTRWIENPIPAMKWKYGKIRSNTMFIFPRFLFHRQLQMTILMEQTIGLMTAATGLSRQPVICTTALCRAMAKIIPMNLRCLFRMIFTEW
ncbi:MAG: hypothetical protein HC906_12640 [Bacteroidales bacterium]|nr:hypothetical protein [Bacteroidales bacterium]